MNKTNLRTDGRTNVWWEVLDSGDQSNDPLVMNKQELRNCHHTDAVSAKF